MLFIPVRNPLIIHLIQRTSYSVCTPLVMTEPPPRRSQRLRHYKSPSAGTVVFEVPELLIEIVNNCSWASRVNLSHATVRARIIVQASIRRRILCILRPFVKDFSSFFVLIQEIKAAIVSSAAWNVMTIDDVGPQDVNIVVPNGSAYGIERLKALLSPSGTTVTFDGAPGIVYENRADRFVKLMQKSVSLATPTGTYIAFCS
jgi:hypothetical protein